MKDRVKTFYKVVTVVCGVIIAALLVINYMLASATISMRAEADKELLRVFMAQPYVPEQLRKYDVEIDDRPVFTIQYTPFPGMRLLKFERGRKHLASKLRWTETLDSKWRLELDEQGSLKSFVYPLDKGDWKVEIEPYSLRPGQTYIFEVFESSGKLQHPEPGESFVVRRRWNKLYYAPLPVAEVVH